MFGYIIVSVFKLLYKNPWCNINNCKHDTQFIVLKILQHITKKGQQLNVFQP